MQQVDNSAGVHRRVVQSAKDDVFERQPTLVSKVVAAQQVNNLLDGHTFLGWHQHVALLGQGRMQTDGHMAIALIQKAFQLAFHAHAAHGDALGTPGETVIGGHHLRHPQHVVQVVHRLSLPHEHDVGQPVTFGQ